jgi:hypothetical protein
VAQEYSGGRNSDREPEEALPELGHKDWAQAKLNLKAVQEVLGRQVWEEKPRRLDTASMEPVSHSAVEF